MKKYKIAYVVSDLKRVGPSNQTLNIIKNSKYKKDSIVLTLFQEPIDTMIDEYKNNSINVECLNLDRVAFVFDGKRRLCSKLKEYNVELVHSYGVKPDCLCQKACKKMNITHIITLRNYPKEDILTRMNYFKAKIALHNHLKALLKCNNVICCSKTICDKMSKDYPNKDFSYIQNGVDIEKYKPVSKKEKEQLRNKYGFDQDKIIYISTSSFIPRKRVEETIKGFIESKKSDILLLLGDGVLWNNLKDKYGHHSNIIFYGKTDNVVEFLQLSDIFISSSESEGLPNGVLEAISCGLNVILSDIPQHKEVLNVLNGAGKLYKLGNIVELTNVIKNKNDIIREYDIKSSIFTMNNMSSKYVEYYERITKNE